MSIPALPENAPFSIEQRAWLNGFLAGMLGANALSPNNASVSTPQAAQNASIAPVEEDEFPWHDATMPLDERLQLAQGKPIKLQLMAAMAQLDCGSCGSDCKTYATTIADGVDRDLTKCVPGGKETSRKLKELVASG